MKDIKIIHISSKKNVAEECTCCFEMKTKFKDFGCHHKLCIDCCQTMKKKSNRTTCLYCDPLPSNHVVINVSPRIYPVDTVILPNNESKIYRSYFLDLICFLISFCICFILGFIIYNTIKFIDSDLEKDNIFDFNKFTFNKGLSGIAYLLAFIYIFITGSMIFCGKNSRNEELRICTLLGCIYKNSNKGYNKIKNIICCLD